MNALAHEKRELDLWLAQEAAYAQEHKAQLVTALARQGDLAARLAQSESAWLELHDTLERMALVDEPRPRH